MAQALFTDTFANCTKESSTNIASQLNNYCDNSGWTGSYVYQAVGGLRLGATSYNGVLQTPALDLTASAGKVSVKFTARAYDTDTDCPLTVSCGNSSESLTIPTSDEGSYIVVLDCAADASQKIRFANTVKKKRVVITGVEIYEGDILAQSDESEAITFDGITATHYLVTGLLPETTYAYDVKALYGGEFSGWSNMIEVMTLAGGSHVYGDVNGDGEVTTVDITCLYNYLLNGDDTYLATSDVDGDGEVTTVDITCIYNVLLTAKK